MSGRAAIASSYEISGVGLAKANTMQFGAIERTISCFKIFPFDKPTNTSAPFMASSSVLTLTLSEAKNVLY